MLLAIITLQMSLVAIVGTLNFHGNSSPVKMKLLNIFLRTNDVDVLFLQEVKTNDFSEIYGYTAYVNVGSESLGTAILTRNGIDLHSVEKLPSGKGISGIYKDYMFLNLYAPSGSNKRKARNLFFAQDVPYLLRSLPKFLIMGGDYNCVLRPVDTTGHFLPSNSLQTLVTDFKLSDAWILKNNTVQYTFFTGNSASRLDRMYVTPLLTSHISSIETVPVPISDHSAVLLRIRLDVPCPVFGRSYWKLNVSCLSDKSLQQNFIEQWHQWLTRQTKYDDLVDWWEFYVKPKIRTFFKQYTYLKHQDEERLINFYYRCILEVQSNYIPTPESKKMISRCQAKILSIYRKRMQGLMVRSRETNCTNNERSNLYFLSKVVKRRQQNTILAIANRAGRIVTNKSEICKAVREHYNDIFVEHKQLNGSISNLKLPAQKQISETENKKLESSVTQKEIFIALQQGKRSKTPGEDGIPHEFYAVFWECIGPTLTKIFNQMLCKKKTRSFSKTWNYSTYSQRRG